MLECTGSVSGAAATALSKVTPSRAMRSNAGVSTSLYPYAPMRSARVVSSVTMTRLSGARMAVPRSRHHAAPPAAISTRIASATSARRREFCMCPHRLMGQWSFELHGEEIRLSEKHPQHQRHQAHQKHLEHLARYLAHSTQLSHL